LTLPPPHSLFHSESSYLVMRPIHPFISDPFWSWRSARLRLAVLLALGVAAMNTMKYNLGMALVCMVNSTQGRSTDLLFNGTTASGNDSCSFYGGGAALDYSVSSELNMSNYVIHRARSSGRLRNNRRLFQPCFGVQFWAACVVGGVAMYAHSNVPRRLSVRSIRCQGVDDPIGCRPHFRQRHAAHTGRVHAVLLCSRRAIRYGRHECKCPF